MIGEGIITGKINGGEWVRVGVRGGDVYVTRMYYEWMYYEWMYYEGRMYYECMYYEKMYYEWMYYEGRMHYECMYFLSLMCIPVWFIYVPARQAYWVPNWVPVGQ